MSLLLPFLLLQIGGAWERMHLHASGSTQPDLFGHSLADIGDVDGDGVAEILVGAPWFYPPGATRFDGAAFLYSGATGALLRRHDGAAGRGGLGSSVAGGADLDGDLTPDYVVGQFALSSPGLVDVYSGATGTLLRQLTPGYAHPDFGRTVAMLGDHDRDGVVDIAVTGISEVFVFSGATGSLLAMLALPAQPSRVVALDDLNGDLIPELAVGCSQASNLPHQNEGAVFVLSGATGATLRAEFGAMGADLFGHDLVAVPDRDGDGRRDLLIGAPQDLGQGYVVLVSTRTGAVLMRWDRNSRYWAQNLGQCVGVSGDMDGDGVEEYLMGGGYMTITDSAGPRRGGLWIVSGADGAVLHEFEANSEEQYLGWACTGLGDLDGDGLAEAAVGAIGAPLAAYGVIVPGSVYVYGFERFLDPSASELSALAGANVTLSFDFPAAAGGWEYRFLVSAAGAGPTRFGVDVPLTLDAFALRSWSGAYPAAMQPQNLHGALDSAGKAVGAFTFAPSVLTPLIGRTLWAAAVAFPPGAPAPQISSASARFTVEP